MVRAVVVANLIMWVEMSSRPGALDEERFIAWRTSFVETGRRRN